MSVIDQMAERYICEAIEKGELSHLSGEGEPLILDDDSHVPEALRTGYRLLKNAGYLPPELEMRREAIRLENLLSELTPDDSAWKVHSKRLILFRMKLAQAGLSSSFLSGCYSTLLRAHFIQKR